MTRPHTIRRSTVLAAPADLVWAAVRTPQAFRFVTAGLVDWRPIHGRTEPWKVGESGTGWLLLAGVVPFSRHRIRVVEIDDEKRLLRSDESGGVIRSWRHDIVVESLDVEQARYTDVVEIDAGLLTPLVAGFAWAFYRLRQRRWGVLAEVLAGADRSHHAVTTAWLRRHEAAFNSGDIATLTADYTDDVVLEAHVDGHRIEVTGSDVPTALEMATAQGERTRVVRVAASGGVVAAQIDDEDGAPYMVSFWELRNSRIVRDVSIVLRRPVAGT
jgi:hypothetical protein